MVSFLGGAVTLPLAWPLGLGEPRAAPLLLMALSLEAVFVVVFDAVTQETSTTTTTEPWASCSEAGSARPGEDVQVLHLKCRELCQDGFDRSARSSGKSRGQDLESVPELLEACKYIPTRLVRHRLKARR